MKPVKITENVYWVGEIDWDLRNFHGYLTQRGSTYNAFLILDEKITLIDNVRPHLYDMMMKRISSLIDPSTIDYIVANHVEMDHSGGLPLTIKTAKNATVITSLQGQKGLMAHYDTDTWTFKVVKSEETVSIGKRSLSFFLTPMVHWPDSMVTYLEGDNILFSNDAFGQHIASSERFDDEYSEDIMAEEAKKYYANIVLPYSTQVRKVIDTLSQIPIDIIAPSHGLIWRSLVKKIITSYTEWAENRTSNHGLIIYDSMWGSTTKIAHAIQEAFEEQSIHVKMINLRKNHISDIMTALLMAKFICIGCPTLNNNMLPTMAGFLTYLKGLSPKGRIGLAFGSYGWGGQAVDQIAGTMEGCGFKLLDSVKIRYVPDEEALRNIRDTVTQQLKKMTQVPL